MTIPKTHNSSITKSKVSEMTKIHYKEFKSLFMKMISDLKEDLKKKQKMMKINSRPGQESQQHG
jgi:hypothetical protein